MLASRMALEIGAVIERTFGKPEFDITLLSTVLIVVTETGLMLVEQRYELLRYRFIEKLAVHLANGMIDSRLLR
jgi:hypothetical protein